MKKTFMKMQSLSRKALLCGGLIAMAAAITGCSSDAPDPGENPTPGVVQTDGDPLTVISDQATLSGLVLNYGNNNPEGKLTPHKMDAAPDHSGAVSVRSKEFDSKNIEKDIIIPSGEEEYKQTLDLQGKEIKVFVAGTFDGDIEGGDNAEVHILKDGVWKAGSKALETPGLEIYDYDDGLVCPDKSNIICSFYGKVFNQPDKNILLGGEKNDKGEFFVEGGITVKTLKLSSSKTQLKANCLVADEAEFTSHNNIKHYIGSFVDVGTLKMIDDGDKGEQAKAKLFLGSGAYVKAGKLYLGKNSEINSLDGTSTIYASNLYTKDRSKGNGNEKLDMAGKFKGAINVFIENLWVGDGAYRVDIKYIKKESENICFYGNGDDEFDKFNPDWMTECPPVSNDGGNNGGNNGGNDGGDNGDNGGNGGGNNGGGEDPIKPIPNPFNNNPEIIAEINAGNHTHSISATSIDVSGNKAYVGWHERGGNIMGCVEEIEVEGNVATVRSWMQTNQWLYAPGDPNGENAATAYDFNHVIYDRDANVLITVGEHAKKGGFIGRIDLNKALVMNGVNKLDVLENRQLGIQKKDGDDLLAGGSGNSVVISPDGKYLLVSSRGGYQAIPYDKPGGSNDPFAKKMVKENKEEKLVYAISYDAKKSLATAGSGKHIALFNGKVVSIEYTAPNPHEKGEEEWWEDNTTALPAKISLWNNWTDFPENPAMSIPVPAFSPVFGKDVIAMDASGIYSCQGHNGVARYNADLGDVIYFNVKTYAEQNPERFSSRERKYLLKCNAAANGLAVDEKYVYVAYGAAGLWVLKKDSFEPVGFYDSAISEYDGNDPEHPKASANYVKVMDDGSNIKKIVVAYGRDGVKVFKLPLD